jgi:hypothetical protein
MRLDNTAYWGMWRDILQMLRCTTAGRGEIYESCIEDLMWSFVDFLSTEDLAERPDLKKKVVSSLKGYNNFLEDIVKRYRSKEATEEAEAIDRELEELVNKTTLCHVCYKPTKDIIYLKKKLPSGAFMKRSICKECRGRELKTKYDKNRGPSC